MGSLFPSIKEGLRAKVSQLAAEKFRLIRLNFPTELEFEPIQLCNAKCFTCPYTKLSQLPDYTKQRMSRQQIEKLLTNFYENLLRYKYSGSTIINPFRFSDPLICPDLDLILDFALKHHLKVQITTNAKGLNSRTIPLLEKNLSAIKDDIVISILGSTEEQVRKNMSIGLDYTIKKMNELKSEKSPILDRIMISLRVIDGTKEEQQQLQDLAQKFSSIGVRYHIRDNWIHNRIQGSISEQTPEHYVVGCKLYKNKLLRRMEVMVNGNVVLCDDDAEGRRVFGNIFEQSIDEIWNGPLKKEHLAIFASQFSTEKSNLLCTNCSRAVYKKHSSSIVDTISEIGLAPMAFQLKNKNFDTIS